MKRYDLAKIMRRAWKLRHEKGLEFPEALHRAWISAKAEPENERRVKAAKEAAGISEETNTWAGWRDLGFLVNHGSKALFQASLIWGSKGDGHFYRASFFGRSQVQAITA